MGQSPPKKTESLSLDFSILFRVQRAPQTREDGESMNPFRQYQLAVYITDAQPLTVVDKFCIDEALRVADRALVILADSVAFKSPRHPFDRTESIAQLLLMSRIGDSLSVRDVPNHNYNEPQWITEIQRIVQEVLPTPQYRLNSKKVVLINSAHADKFPDWDVHRGDLPQCPSKAEILADFYEDWNHALFVPREIQSRLRTFRESAGFKPLQEEHEYYKTYDPKKYDVTMVTADAVVVCAGHILMVTRKFAPGKGTLALPGGFLNQKEWVLDGIIRELKEETRINVSKSDLVGGLKEIKFFDNPTRSARGRVITFAGLIELPLGPQGLPVVRGTDDAKKAQWIPLAQVLGDREKVFEDHAEIIAALVGVQ
jgi:bifunctional NMN adenylyltransferase/nudix hydrolase